MSLTAIIPVYQAEHCLEELTHQLLEHGKPLCPQFSILFVEDGSGDGSWDKICELSQKFCCVRGLKLDKNYGHQFALTAGVDYCDSDWVVVLDCDLQDPPAAIGDLFAKAQEGYEIVYASRRNRQDSYLKILLGDSFFALFRSLTGLPLKREVANFYLASRRALTQVKNDRQYFRHLSIQLSFLPLPKAAVAISSQTRHEGKSSYTLVKLIRVALHVLITYLDKILPRINRVLAYFLGAAIALMFFRLFPVGIGWLSSLGWVLVGCCFVGLALGFATQRYKSWRCQSQPLLYEIERYCNC